MCLTIPAKVIKRDGNNALVWQYDKAVSIDVSFLPNVKEDDWLLYVSDTAVKKIDSKDAQEMTELLASKPPIETNLLNPKLVETIKNSRIRDLTKEEIVFLLNSEDLEKEALFREAEITRKTYIRDFICVHGIIEFSNYCRNNCNYCGLRRDNNLIRRYRMDIEEIVETAVSAVNDKGYKLLVLQSGEDLYYTGDVLSEIIKRIKELCRVFVFVSIGDRDFETYKKIREAGASGVLYRFETSNSRLFKTIHPAPHKITDINMCKNTEYLPKGHDTDATVVESWGGVHDKSRSFKRGINPMGKNYTVPLSSSKRTAGFLEKGRDKNFSRRFEHLEFFKKLGYFIATGSIIGLPGQSAEDLAEDLLMLKKLNVNMISSGPFIPCEGTPFFGEPAGSIDMSLKVISTARLMMKKARIPVVTALETIDQEKGRRYAMRAGANALMFNLTPEEYFNDYKIYPNRFVERNSMIAKYALFNNDGSYKMLEERLKSEIV